MSTENYLNSTEQKITSDMIPRSDKSENVIIKDTYANSDMKHFLYGKQVNEYQLFILISVLLYYDQRAYGGKTENNPNTKSIREKFHSALYSSVDIKNCFTKLQNEFNCKSIECIFANALLAYNGDENDLLIRALNFSGRVLKLNSKTEWLDNWRINAFGTCLSTIMWSKYDSANDFTVQRKFIPINSSVKINFDSFIKFCVNPLREFIIRMNVYPSDKIPVNIKEILSIMNSKQFMDKTKEEIADLCYNHFVYSYIGSHGCNALIDSPDRDPELYQWTATIPEIKLFLKRYPAMIFGGVFNTSPYGKAGQHWMTVMFHNKYGKQNLSSTNNSDQRLYTEAVLFCSQGSGWDAFDLSSEILKELRAGNPVPTNYNQEYLQTGDGYSCGNFSIVSNFLMILNNMDINKTATDIGKNGKNLGDLVGKHGEIDIYSMRRALFGTK